MLNLDSKIRGDVTLVVGAVVWIFNIKKAISGCALRNLGQKGP